MPGSPKKSKKKGSGVGDGETDSMPLLDTVNALVEKEKLLLSLQMMEKKKEAEEWKSKYEMLVSTVADSSNATGDYKALEIAADLEGKGCLSEFEEEEALHDGAAYKVIDRSGRNTSSAELQKLSKGIILAKGKKNPTHVFVRDSSLTDANTAPLMSLLKVPTADALDLRHNDLGLGFEDALVEMLKGRRKTPQYLCLDGNMPLSLSTNFSDVMHLLTERTWGLSVSLQDMTVIEDDNKKKQSNSKSKLDFVGGPKRALGCHSFLSALNGSYTQGSDDVSKGTTKTSASAKSATKKGVANARVRPVDHRPGGLQLMAHLGLTDGQLSPDTVAVLGDTLRLAASSLTDLDISRSYTSLAGAAVLRDALDNPNCNLVRVCAAGNAFGDAGVVIIADGLRANKTLTYLDVCSNDFNINGLDALIKATTSSKVMTCLDVRGNRLSRMDILSAEETLVSKGCAAVIKWQVLPRKSAAAAPACPATAATTKVLYSARPVVSRELSSTQGGVRMLGADSMKLSANADSSEDDGKPLLLRWTARVVSLSGSSSSSSRLSTSRANATTAGSTDGVSLEWQLRMRSSATDDYVVASGRLSELSDLLPQSEHKRDCSSKWVECRAVVTEKIRKGSLELWLNLGTAAGGRTRRAVAEVHSFSVETWGATENIPVCGDLAAWSAPSNALNSRSVLSGLDPFVGSSLASALPPGHELARALVWSGFSTTEASVAFEAKLSSMSAVGAASSSSSPSKGAPPSGLFYRWAVTVLSSHGSAEVVAEGTCGKGEEDETSRLLSPWQWGAIRTKLPFVGPNDIILISLQCDVKSGRKSASLATPQARNCALLLGVSSLLEHASEEACILGGTSNFATGNLVHNSSFLMGAM